MPTIITPEQAADLIADAIIRRLQRIATSRRFAEIISDDTEDVGSRHELRVPMFPDSAAAPGATEPIRASGDTRGHSVRVADAWIHW